MDRLHKMETFCGTGRKNDAAVSAFYRYAALIKKNRSHSCDLFFGQILQNVEFFE